MPICVSVVALAAVLGIPLAPAAGQPTDETSQSFLSWEMMRLIRQEGEPQRIRAIQFGGAGESMERRATLVVVNTRQSRLDLYHWLAPAERRDQADLRAQADPRRPNDLPMAPEFATDELMTSQLPHDVLAADLDGDGTTQLLVLVSDPNRVIAFRHEESADASGSGGAVEGTVWREAQSWELLPGDYVGDGALMLLRESADAMSGRELLISCNEGIQRLPLDEGARGSWRQPRRREGRLNWWLADLDGDRDDDLVEWVHRGRQGLRWSENDGLSLLPPAVIDDQPTDAVVVLRQGGAAQSGVHADELLTLGGAQAGLMRRLGLDYGDASPIGERRPLPLARTDPAAWTGLRLDGSPALAALADDQPSLFVFRLTDSGWSQPQSFPIVSDVQAIVAPPPVQDGVATLLMWPRDAGDLLISRWEDGRFSYPRPFISDLDKGDSGSTTATSDDRKVLAIESVGTTTWWVQRVGVDLRLYVWATGHEQPRCTVFPGVAAKADKARYLGDDRLLVLDQYARNPRLVRLIDAETVSSEPPHIKKGKIEDYRLVAEDDSLRVARLADGVLQWLDEELRPHDQVQLPDGEMLAAFTPMANSDSAWALPRGAQFLHRLAPDDSGVMRLADTHRLPDGLDASDIRLDPHLGLLLINPSAVMRLAPGRSRELVTRQALDSRVGRPSGVRETTVHRLLTADVDGDGRTDVLLCDDRRHQLTLLTRQDGELAPALSWPVFENRTYPYGADSGGLVSEPRAVVAADLDGDGRQDLCLLCHDRLVIYLAHAGGDHSVDDVEPQATTVENR